MKQSWKTGEAVCPSGSLLLWWTKHHQTPSNTLHSYLKLNQGQFSYHLPLSAPNTKMQLQHVSPCRVDSCEAQLPGFCCRISAQFSARQVDLRPRWGVERWEMAVSALLVTLQAPHGHNGKEVYGCKWTCSSEPLKHTPPYSRPAWRHYMCKSLTLLAFEAEIKRVREQCADVGSAKWEREKLILRSYLHKQLDNGLIIRLHSVLRDRQRHGSCCSEVSPHKDEFSPLPRPT